MKRLLILAALASIVSGCVVVPAADYDRHYYRSDRSEDTTTIAMNAMATAMAMARTITATVATKGRISGKPFRESNRDQRVAESENIIGISPNSRGSSQKYASRRTIQGRPCQRSHGYSS